MCQNICFDEKKTRASSGNIRKIVFRAQSKIVFGISKKKIIHHKHYTQDDHSKQNGVKLHTTNYKI